MASDDAQGDTQSLQDEKETLVKDESPLSSHSPPRDIRARYKYNLFCRLLFLWVEPLMWTGFRRSLVQNDLAVRAEEVDATKLLYVFNRHWNNELKKKQRGKQASLSLTLFKCAWWRFIITGLISLTETSLQIGQAVIIGYLGQYFVIVSPTLEDTSAAYLYASGLLLSSLIMSVLHGVGFLSAQKLGMIMRVSTTAAIHQKIMKLSHGTIGKISTGHVINLASNDVQRFDQAFLLIHQLWISPLVLVAFMYLLYINVGFTGFIAMLVVFVVLPLQLALTRLFSRTRLNSAKITDKRVKVMNEIISGMRVIKMYAWEHAFKNVIDRLRRHESAQVLKAGLIQGNNLAVDSSTTSIMAFGVFSAFLMMGGAFSPKNVFTPLSLFIFLQRNVVRFFVRCVFQVMEAKVAVTRIQKLLELEEVSDNSGSLSHLQPTPEESQNFPEHQPNFNSDNEYHMVPKMGNTENLYNKTTVSTCLDVDGRFQPSLMVSHLAASWSHDTDKLIFQNVNFEVNSSAPLLVVVGPVGTGKSTLLQCLLRELKPMEGTVEVRGKVSYASQDPWVFSGTLRENILFGDHFDEKWYNEVTEACALLEDINQLPSGDLTLVGERGVTLSGGQKARVNLARAIYRKAQVFLLDDPLSAVDTVVARHIFDRCIRGLLKDSVVVLVTHQLQFAQQADKILAIKNGEVQAYGTINELVAKGIDTNDLLGVKRADVSRDLFSEIVEIKELVPRESVMKGKVGSFSIPSEEKGHGAISFKTYVKYFHLGAGYAVILLVLAVMVAGETSRVLSDWWIAEWAGCLGNMSFQNETLPSYCYLTHSQRIGISAGLTGLVIILNFTRVVLSYVFAVNASRILHNITFQSILRVPIRFFDTNPIGRVLNRFSKDVSSLDDHLPFQITELLTLTLKFLSSILTAAIANLWVFIPAAVIIVVFLAMRHYYLKTARDIKRLESIARSPIYSHLSTSLLGLSTIRAFGREETSNQYFCQYLNLHSQNWYLYLVTTRWFGMRIDLLTAVFLAIVSFGSIPLASTLNAGLVGLALTYTVSLSGTFQFCVRLSAEVENTMVSAERLFQYSALKPEAHLDTIPTNKKPPPDWPHRGKIVLDNVTFRYSEDTPIVLKLLSCTINPAEKIGIVGRTGAGKSSLIALLFRLAEPLGELKIDDVVITDIGLHDLRKKISIIPQDPVLFSGTVRYNLDPFDEHSDQEIWDVLEQVQLKVSVQSLEGGLEGQVAEGGSNFSVGQRQLVCLARALLRNNKILVLDEATANVDVKTDEIIQSAIKERFFNCTVLTIAHRLNTIMGSDRIMVMDEGQMVEWDEPYMLLQDPNSLFKKMVDKTGSSASVKLYHMAAEAHQSRNHMQ